MTPACSSTSKRSRNRKTKNEPPFYRLFPVCWHRGIKFSARPIRLHRLPPGHRPERLRLASIVLAAKLHRRPIRLNRRCVVPSLLQVRQQRYLPLPRPDLLHQARPDGGDPLSQVGGLSRLQQPWLSSSPSGRQQQHGATFQPLWWC